MLWHDTYLLGCAAGRWIDEKTFPTHTFLTVILCHYSPQGNMENQPVYHIGKSCAACPKRCSKKHNNVLCSKHNLYVNDTKIPRILTENGSSGTSISCFFISGSDHLTSFTLKEYPIWLSNGSLHDLNKDKELPVSHAQPTQKPKKQDVPSTAQMISLNSYLIWLYFISS